MRVLGFLFGGREKKHSKLGGLRRGARGGGGGGKRWEKLNNLCYTECIL